MNYKMKRDRLRKKYFDQLTCLPLKCYSDIEEFLENPPSWRTLCNELTPRSKYVIRNMDKHASSSVENIQVESSLFNYCHFESDDSDSLLIRHDITEKKIPKTLVCHDMANGYHDDSLIDGSIKFDAYSFYNWAGIDIFCYFSHHLITIPPLAWINIAHNHGVKVIGTIISEWTEGGIFWDEILESKEEYENFANSIVTIAKIMKFDGWLLNIENKITKPLVLLEFVRYLHSKLHTELQDPILIWYDSVTIKGKLNWQNGLTEKNIDFFNVCDGFFTNYSWSVEDVEKSVQLAGERLTDLYIGIDVWGRNVYGGGQFNTQQAVTVAYREGCSLAIFAPAWTHEALTKDPQDLNYVNKGEALNKFQRFLLRDRALWCTLWPFLHTHVPCHLPFRTSFCRGQGIKRWMYGEVISPGPWYNLRLQQYQLNAAHGEHGFVLRASTRHADGSAPAAAATRDKKGIMRNNEPPAQELPDGLAEASKLINPTEELEVEEDTDKSGKDSRYKRIRCFFLKHIFRKSGQKAKDTACEQREPEPAVESTSALRDVAVAHTHLKEHRSSLVRLVLPEEYPDDEVPKTPELQAPPTPDVPDSIESATSKADSKNQSMFTMSMNLNLKMPESKQRWALSYISKERECFQPYFHDGFIGGLSLKVNPSDITNRTHRTNRLFYCDFPCDHALIFCVVTKRLEQYPDQSLNIKLELVNVDQNVLEVTLLGRNLTQSSTVGEHSTGIYYIYPLHSESQEAFQDLRRYLLTNEPSFYVPISNIYGWDVRYYELPVPHSRLTAVNCRTAMLEGGILLGYFGICKKNV